MQEIARLFGSLGFNVDMTGLDSFRNQIKLMRTDMSNLGRDVKDSSTNINNFNRNLDGLNTRLDKVSISKANNVLKDSYTNVAGSVGKVDTAFVSIANNRKRVTEALGKIHASVKAGEPFWDRYRASVLATRDALSQVNGKMQELRKNSTVSIRTSNGSSNSQSRTYNTRSEGKSPITEGIQDFFRSMTPATLMGGGLAGAGFLTKEIVQRGRAQQQMEQSLRFATKDTEEFSSALKYVREEALRLGLSSATLGKTFATVSGAASDKMTQPQIKDMFTNMSEYFVAVHAGEYEKSLMYLAIQQMFSIGKIQGQEIGQLTGTGLITRAQLNTAIREVYDLKDNSKIEKLQVAGKLDPAKVLQQLFGNLSKRAHESGSFDKAMQSSVVKQGQATEQLNQLSQQIMEGGLDALLAGILEQLVSLVEILRDVQAGFNGVKKSLDAVSGGNGGAILSFGLLAVFLLRNLKLVKSVVSRFINMRKIMLTLSALMRGRFAVALRTGGNLFGWWKWLILGVIVLLDRLGARLNGNNNEWTWVDDLIAKFEIMGQELEIASLKMKILWHNTKLSFDPTWWSNKPWELVSTDDRKLKGLEGTVGLMKKEDVQKQFNKAVASNKTAITEISNKYNESKQIPSKYAQAQDIKVYMDNIINFNGKTYHQQTVNSAQAVRE